MVSVFQDEEKVHGWEEDKKAETWMRTGLKNSILGCRDQTQKQSESEGIECVDFA
jgi:hypothetical protein